MRGSSIFRISACGMTRGHVGSDLSSRESRQDRERRNPELLFEQHMGKENLDDFLRRHSGLSSKPGRRQHFLVEILVFDLEYVRKFGSCHGSSGISS
jgi:hypothetical protein